MHRFDSQGVTIAQILYTSEWYYNPMLVANYVEQALSLVR